MALANASINQLKPDRRPPRRPHCQGRESGSRAPALSSWEWTLIGLFCRTSHGRSRPNKEQFRIPVSRTAQSLIADEVQQTGNR